jgi:hypothetical protein
MTIHRPLVTVHAGPTPPAREWLSAEDAALLGMGRACVLCGRLVTPLDQRVVFLPSLALYATRCFSCRDADTSCERLHAVLAARYDPGRWSLPYKKRIV